MIATLKSRLKIRPAYCLMLTSALVVAGCSMPDMSMGDYQAGSAEELLAAEGEWKLIEEKRSPSPVQKHMDSRGQVSPTQISKSGNYTEKAKDMHVDEDIHFRILRLERQMDNVRGDLSAISPVLAELPDEKPRKMAKKPVKIAKKAAPVAKKVHKPIVGGPLRVTSVRTGVHPGKVRFVLDVTGKPNFSYDLDNGEKLLLIELPKTGWDARMSKDFGGNPLIKSYNVQKASDGTSRLAIELKSTVKVGMAKVFAPNHVYGHRIVLDVSAL